MATTVHDMGDHDAFEISRQRRRLLHDLEREQKIDELRRAQIRENHQRFLAECEEYARREARLRGYDV